MEIFKDMNNCRNRLIRQQKSVCVHTHTHTSLESDYNLVAIRKHRAQSRVGKGAIQENEVIQRERSPGWDCLEQAAVKGILLFRLRVYPHNKVFVVLLLPPPHPPAPELEIPVFAFFLKLFSLTTSNCFPNWLQLGHVH